MSGWKKKGGEKKKKRKTPTKKYKSCVGFCAKTAWLSAGSQGGKRTEGKTNFEQGKTHKVEGGISWKRKGKKNKGGKRKKNPLSRLGRSRKSLVAGLTLKPIKRKKGRGGGLGKVTSVAVAHLGKTDTGEGGKQSVHD